MQKIILEAFKELGPCGLRTVVSTLGDDAEEIKTAVVSLLSDGMLEQLSNKQYRLTAAGRDYLKAPTSGSFITPDNEPCIDSAITDGGSSAAPDLNEVSTDELIQLAKKLLDDYQALREAILARVKSIL